MKIFVLVPSFHMFICYGCSQSSENWTCFKRWSFFDLTSLHNFLIPDQGIGSTAYQLLLFVGNLTALKTDGKCCICLVSAPVRTARTPDKPNLCSLPTNPAECFAFNFRILLLGFFVIVHAHVYIASIAVVTFLNMSTLEFFAIIDDILFKTLFSVNLFGNKPYILMKFRQ